MANNHFSRKLTRYYTWYTFLFFVFLISLAILEREGVPRSWIGYLFMFVTIIIYAGIGVLCRTSDITEYYVAGRRVPAVFNGMATAADWMSAASFLSLAGGLYLQGFDGLAYIVGWTGGFCLVAMLIAPYIRKFGQYTIPDFLGARFAGKDDSNLVRLLAVLATVFISFIYVVAQIYGVGLITSRFTGVDFSVGIFLGLASILVCSFLGGMRAITWTQVAQYIIILVAFLIPTMWLSVKHAGNPIPQVAYGAVLAKLSQREIALESDPKEREVRAIFQRRADDAKTRLQGLPASWEAGRQELARKLDALRRHDGSLMAWRATERQLMAYPKTPDDAARMWSEQQAADQARAQAPERHTTPFPGADRAQSDERRNNFLALVVCLMLGTAALPHILMRSYTTPSVQETRVSVFWTLFFILLVYLTIPALAVLVKYDVYSHLVGIVQLAEIAIDSDVLVLATPEIGGLPYVISGLVAAGGLAAALSTADGLLLAISNALSHDVYYKVVDPNASTQKRVTISKLLLLAVAFIAAYAASQKPADILSLVGAAFSLAGSALFPALVMGVFWKRANHAGALAGMLAGFGVCLYYMLHTNPILGGSTAAQWFHIAPISAGVFGVPAGLAVLMIVSLCTRAPDGQTAAFVDHVRAPE